MSESCMTSEGGVDWNDHIYQQRYNLRSRIRRSIRNQCHDGLISYILICIGQSEVDLHLLASTTSSGVLSNIPKSCFCSGEVESTTSQKIAHHHKSLPWVTSRNVWDVRVGYGLCSELVAAVRFLIPMTLSVLMRCRLSLPCGRPSSLGHLSLRSPQFGEQVTALTRWRGQRRLPCYFVAHLNSSSVSLYHDVALRS